MLIRKQNKNNKLSTTRKVFRSVFYNTKTSKTTTPDNGDSLDDYVSSNSPDVGRNHDKYCG